jgi:hypothetical protein
MSQKNVSIKTKNIEEKRKKLFVYNEEVLQEFFGMNEPKRLIIHALCHDITKRNIIIDYDKLKEFEDILNQRKKDKINKEKQEKEEWVREHLDELRLLKNTDVTVVETYYQPKWPNDPIWYMYTYDVKSSHTIIDVTCEGNLILDRYSPTYHEFELSLKDGKAIWKNHDFIIKDISLCSHWIGI